MTAEIDLHRLFHILIVHPKDQSVLTLEDHKLPVIFYDDFVDMNLDKLCAYVRTNLRLPFDVVLLRTECDVPNRTWYSKVLLIFDIPCHALPHTTAGCKWVTKSKINDICVEPPTRAVMEYLRKYTVNGLSIHSDRLYPSSKPGWFDDAREWTVEVLSKAGFDIKYVYQERNSGQSSMLVANSHCGSKFYVKIPQPRGLNDEAGVTLALSKEMPNEFMKPLAVDLSRRCIVMSDYGPSLPDDDLANSNPELFRRVLSAWAKIQINSVSKSQGLLQTDLPVMDGDGLKSKIEEMFADPEWWIAQQEGMKEVEKSKYDESTYKQMYVDYVEELCRKIGDYRVPLALVHGDLNPVNVIPREDSGFAFIDFAFTCWSFPFLDALQFGQACGAARKDLDFYLEFWTNYESVDRLRELLALMDECFGVNYELLSYQLFAHSEESSRRGARQELRYPVCRTFAK